MKLIKTQNSVGHFITRATAAAYFVILVDTIREVFPDLTTEQIDLHESRCDRWAGTILTPQTGPSELMKLLEKLGTVFFDRLDWKYIEVSDNGTAVSFLARRNRANADGENLIKPPANTQKRRCVE